MIKILIDYIGGFTDLPGFIRLTEYITFRILMALVTGLAFNLLFGHRIICFLHSKGLKDSSGDFSSINVYSKRGTPTAGGLMIILSAAISVLLWCDLRNPNICMMLIGFVYLGFVGFLDDFLKIRFGSSLSGLSQLGKTVLILLFLIPFSIYFISDFNPISEELKTQIFFPFFKNPLVDIGPYLFILFTIFTMFAIINAVNIADGMDGLLGGLSIVTISVYCVFAYIIGSKMLAAHFLFPNIPGSFELTIFGGALIGSIIGFLWYNFYPAEVFMGDTGSLAIGGAIGMFCFFTKQEFLFVIVGGVFVLEIFTSLLNDKIGNMSRFGRRLVDRAPFHYSLSHRGIAEPKAVFKLFIYSLILAMIGLLSIKIR